MLDGQGCLLPVLHNSLAPSLLLEEDSAIASVPWLLPQICRAEASSQLSEVFPSSLASSLPPLNLRGNPVPGKRKRAHRFKKTMSSSGFEACQDVEIDYRKEVSNEAMAVFSGEIPEKQIGTGCNPRAGFADAMGFSCHNTPEVRAQDKKACRTEEGPSDYTSFLPGLDDETALRCLAHVSLSDYHRLALVAQRYRRLVRSSLLYDLRRTYKVVEQWICVYTSGDNVWTAFDPKQQVWRSLPPANVDPLFSLSDRESLSAGTHLLWLGREVFDFACYRYDLISNKWDRGPPMVNSRCLFASASCGEFAYVAGGFKVGGAASLATISSVLNTAERYDARSGQWKELPPMETPRQKCSGVFMDGKFYVIGGKDKDHNILTSGEVYDPVTETWKTIPEMYVPPETPPSFEPSPPLVAVANNELYAIESSTNLLKGYIKSSKSWKVLGPVPVRTDVCNGWGLAFKALGDELFVIGSHESPFYHRYSVSGVAVFSWRPCLDPLTPEWQSGVPPPEWKMVNLQVRGSGSFLYNCAVMSC